MNQYNMLRCLYLTTQSVMVCCVTVYSNMFGFVMLCWLGVGLALCYRCPIGIRLSRCFLKMLTCRGPHPSDYAQVDPQVCYGLQAIAAASEQELRDMQLTFEPPNGTAFALSHGESLPAALAEKCAAMCEGCASCTDQWTSFTLG